MKTRGISAERPRDDHRVAARAVTPPDSGPNLSRAAVALRQQFVNAVTIRCMARTRIIGNLRPPWPVYC